ncbi:MAG: PAS domain S-box protein [Thermoguttaceae bacterium]
MRRNVVNTLAESENGPVEHRILHRDGSVRWVRHKIVSHHDGEGRLVRYDGLIEDITERKVSEERFRLLVESAPDAMVVADGEGHRIEFTLFEL